MSLQSQMFEKKYIIMEVIGRNNQKMTSIVKNKQNKYFIAKKVSIQDAKTNHQIQLMKTLHHPNIISLHQIIQQGNWAYIIEEYCQDGDLQYHLKRQIRSKRLFAEEVVARWMLQILLAVEYLHHYKIIHRDIRPKNIFLTSAGNIKLGSFKTSKILEEQMSYAQTMINSPYYMAPELLQGKSYDVKVDIWAFGCILFQLCSLKPPNSAMNLGDLLKIQGKSKLQELPYSYSKQLNLIYQRCMKKNVVERYSAKELLKTNYFLSSIQKLIKDQGLNITLQEKIPIKKYKIHKTKYEKIKLKRGLVKEKLSIQKKQSMLPKIEINSNKINRVFSKGKSKEKALNPILTPIIKRNADSKQKALKSVSTERKKLKTENDGISKQKKDKVQHIFEIEKIDYKQSPKQKKCILAPPLLPKPLKKKQKQEVSERLDRKKTERLLTTQEEINQNFETTMSKQDLSKELVHFQKRQKQLKDINAGLNKIFQNLNISEQQQQIEFNFDEDSQLRLTEKQNKAEAQSLLQTYKSKLEQLIQQINYKYCPDMQPIAQKTTQFDSNSFSKNRLASQL